ncbi:PREDICTED: microtubule-associated protein futsch-like isoform X2 [Polistes dominula]|uniref:Microtubule-associated protein n=1 Tax=Polistes dominula TaxID=743375 RepID=A0ABM1IEJ2_POLDO|nr:PREDICTED: microtubule-associated protein futsch-like isoform X2 [Polistes dominula]
MPITIRSLAHIGDYISVKSVSRCLSCQPTGYNDSSFYFIKVKQGAPLSQGFQARPQVTPTGFPRYPVNNGPIGANRPAGQQAQHPIYGLESHTSIGQSKSSQQQLVQLRPHGLSPRPPGNNQVHHPGNPVHSPRQIQSRQNPVSPQSPQNPQNPRFPGSPGVRVANPTSGGPPPVPQPVGPRPNYQRNVIEQRTEQRILNLSASASTNQQQGQSFNSPRPLKNSVPQRPRNDPSLNTTRPCQLSNKENKQSVRPRIIIEKMPDLDEEKSDLVRENSIQKKKADVRGSGENDDDDDDVVMDTEKSPRQNGSTVSDTDKSPRPSDNLPPNKDKSPQKNGNADRSKESLSDSSVSPKIGQKMEDSGKSVTRPGTATIDTKSERKSPERMIVPVNDNEQPEDKETSSKSLLDKSEDKTSNKNDSIDEDKSVPTKNDQIGDDVKDEVKKESSSSSRPASSKMEDKIDQMKTEQRSSVVEMKINEDSKSEIVLDESKEKKVEKDNNKVDELTTKEDSAKCPASPQTQTIHSAGQNDQSDSTPTKKDQIEEKLTNLENLTNNLTPENVDQMPRTPSKSPPSADIIKENKQQSPPPASPSPSVGSPSNIPTPIKNSDEASKTPSKSPSPDVTKEDNSKEALNDSPTVQSAEQRPKTPATKSPSPSPTSPSPDVVMDDKRKLTPSPSNNLTMQNLEQDSKTPSKSSDISRASTPTVVDVQAENKSESLNLEKPSRPTSALSKDSTSEKEQTPTVPASSPSLEMQEKLSLPESLPTPPKSPLESVQGFDNGQRRSLSSPGSPKSPKSAISIKPCEGEKKKTTFAEDSIIKKDESLEEKTEGSSRETSKPTTPTGKPRRAQTPIKLQSEKRKKDIENDSAINDLTKHNVSPTTNGVADSPTKKSPSKSKESDKRSTAGSPTKSPSKSSKSLPKTPETPSSTGSQEKKKVPMNKVQVGAAPSPNLKTVRSKIGSLENASYKPGGGKVKIENRKLDFSKAQPKIAAKNEKYTPSGGDKKISQIKLQWNAKPKVGSLDNATYKPGGGDKKIETVKLDFKDKAKPKVGSKDNAKHVPGGGSVKIQTQKVDIKAESKIGSMDNVKHKPGGGDKKIFNDKDYLRQTGSNVESLCGSGSQVQSTEEQITDEEKKETETRNSDLPQPPPSTPTRGRTVKSPSRVVTAQAVRSSLAKSPTSNKNNVLPKDADVPPAAQNLQRDEDRSEKTITEKKSPIKEDSVKSLKPPSTPPRPPNNLKLKYTNKTSPRKTSPNELRLPKLATSPVHQEINTVSETSPKLILPKLIESSMQSTRVAQ